MTKAELTVTALLNLQDAYNVPEWIQSETPNGWDYTGIAEDGTTVSLRIAKAPQRPAFTNLDALDSFTNGIIM